VAPSSVPSAASEIFRESSVFASAESRGQTPVSTGTIISVAREGRRVLFSRRWRAARWSASSAYSRLLVGSSDQSKCRRRSVWRARSSRRARTAPPGRQRPPASTEPPRACVESGLDPCCSCTSTDTESARAGSVSRAERSRWRSRCSVERATWRCPSTWMTSCPAVMT